VVTTAIDKKTYKYHFVDDGTKLIDGILFDLLTQTTTIELQLL
jgi:hypothetical protein